MFKALPPGSQIATEPRYIVSLRRSTNTVVLAMGGGTSVVRASIVGLCTRQGLYEVYVFLGSAEAEGRGVARGTLFRCDPPELDLDGYEKKLVEAVQMVEGQGFSVARVEFRASTDEQKQALQAILPFAPVQPRQSGAFPALGAVPRPSGAHPSLDSAARPSGAFPALDSARRPSGTHPGLETASRSSLGAAAVASPATAAPATAAPRPNAQVAPTQATAAANASSSSVPARVSGSSSVIPQERLAESPTLGSGSHPRPLVVPRENPRAKPQATDVLATLLSLL